ncbi:MAG: hypothetical protein MUE72_12800 [Chitinophagaceae bacterium]|nr:hypothetical protein [Chitinophagaceae bacterium]
MKKTTLLLLLIGVTFNLFAQSTEDKKTDTTVRNKKVLPKTYTTKPSSAIYLEGGGNSIIYSVNYDRRFTKRLDGLGFRVGLGYFPMGDYNITAIPIGINHLVGKNGHFVEAGVNVTVVNSSAKNNNITKKEALFGQIDFGHKATSLVGGVSMGYRYQPVNKHLNFRTGVETLLGKRADERAVFAISAHISFGYNF